MPNTSVRAAAEGMPNLNRRSLLLGLAAASTAAAAPVAAAAVAPAETPELIRLADELPATYDRYLKAWHADAAIRKKWHAVWPLAPDEISNIPANSAEHPWDIPGEKESSFEGGFLWRKGEKMPRIITEKSYWVEGQLRAAKRRLKRSDSPLLRAEVARLTRIREIAENYENECIRVKEACHDEYTAGWKARNAAAEAVCNLIGEIMAQPDETVEGLLIKAQALETFDRMTDRDQKAAIFEPNKWHGQIAASILRHAKGGA